MAKIKIAGDAMVVESTQTLETLMMVERYRPHALCLKDEDGNVTFKVGTTSGKGSINQYGVSFGSATHNDDAFATVTTEIPAGIESATSYAEDRVGAAILRLNEIEEQVVLAAAEVEEELAKVRENIQVL